MGNKKNNKSDVSLKLINRYHHLGSLAEEESTPAYMGQISGDGYQSALKNLAQLDKPSLAIYIHLPFCSVRCLNCERNSTITQDHRMIDEYLDNMNKEMDLVTQHIGVGIKLKQLHIGGGTPNYLSDPQLVRLMDIIDHHFGLDAETETSLEAHPKRATVTQLELLNGLGFKHINFGVRDLNSNVQKAIGRVNSFDMMKDVFHSARNVGFESISMDLMYGLPGQTLETIEDSTSKMVELAPDKIDCFSFVRRTNVMPHQIALDVNTLPTRAEKLLLFNKIAEGLTDTHYTWIGLECFAKNSDELSTAKNQNNLKRNWIGYTENPAKNLIGFGVNASSEVDGLCVQNMLDLGEWRDAITTGILPIKGGIQLKSEDLEKRAEIIDLMCNPDLTQSSKILIPDPALFANSSSH